MKSRVSFRSVLVVLALAFCLSSGEVTTRAQMACINGCLGQLDDCNTRSGGSTACEDEYDSCVENCLSEGG